MPTTSNSPEERARETIDTLLEQAGWIIQDVAEANVRAGRGVAIREFPLQRGITGSFTRVSPSPAVPVSEYRR